MVGNGKEFLSFFSDEDCLFYESHSYMLFDIHVFCDFFLVTGFNLSFDVSPATSSSMSEKSLASCNVSSCCKKQMVSSL